MIGGQYENQPITSQTMPVYLGAAFIILGLIIYVIVAKLNDSKQKSLQDQIDQLNESMPNPSEVDLAAIIKV